MDSRSELVRIAYKSFCNWGQTKVVRFDKPYKGGPTPVWKNVSEEWFQKLARASLVFLLVCAVEYLYLEGSLRGPEYEKLKAEEKNIYFCYERANISFIVNIISMGANFVLYSYLEKIPYATDIRWFQYSTVLGANVAF